MSTKSQIELRFDRLIARRENIFKRIQLCYEAGDRAKRNPTDAGILENFQTRYGRLPKALDDYREVVQEIVVVKQTMNPDERPDYGILDAFEDLYDRIEHIAHQLLSNRPTPESNNGRSRIHMPKIELVKFDGNDVSLWPLFHDNFLQLVHKRSDFNDAEKLQYLLGSLSDKALKTCNGVEAVPENYNIIWDLLVETYNDQKFLANLYLDRLFNFRTLPNNHPNNLQIFLQRFDTNVTALQRLKLNNLDDYILTYIAMSKLSQETVNAFELIRTSQNLPTYEELTKFIKQQSKVNVKIERSRSNLSHSNFYTNSKFPKAFVSNLEPSNDRNCFVCHKGVHLLKDCQIFLNNSQEQRFRLIKDKNLCINCFSSKHKVSSCTSKFSCRVCKAKHHTLLHRHEQVNKTVLPVEGHTSVPGPSQDNTTSLFTKNHNQSFSSSKNIVLLSTALVKVIDRWNQEQTIRFLIDTGSMSNLLTLECCRKLGLTYSKISTNIIGIGGAQKSIIGQSCFKIHSNISPHVTYPIEVFIIDKITNLLPDCAINTDSMKHLVDLPLADPTFHTPGVIDGILGASVFSEIIDSCQISGPPGTPSAIKTSLGYIVLGSAISKEIHHPMQTLCTVKNLDDIVQNMWELEDYSPPVPTSEDEVCESLFKQSFTRGTTGRYTVALPFKDDPSRLGNSYFLAEKRLLSLEKRLSMSPDLRQMYNSVILDYIDQGHMSIVSNKNNSLSYFIPHHCVFKPDSVSTPCRVVFDASMKTESGLSLNDILYTGPKLQNNVITILLNFRLHSIAMTSDVKQMYRQINICNEHKQYQQILWRFSVDEPIQTYQLNTVTFGIKSSPFLSLRTIKQLTCDESKSYPEAALYVNRDMYIDDFICSVPTINTAFDVYSQVINLFQTGCFEVVKWVSNSSELLSKIPDSLKLSKPIEFKANALKVLGLQWNPVTDNFSFKLHFSESACTKRHMLSLVARTFDPLGMLAPTLLLVKLLIKKLWELKLGWDEPAPSEISNSWVKFQNEFEALDHIEIPRHILVFEGTSLTLIGFADASPAAYAAIVYARTVDSSNHINVTFLCAQSKVTPTSKVTLPRLELCAATLLAKLVAHIRNIYSPRHTVEAIYAFSDSMITLNWIHSPTKKWNPFILNRVSKIESYLPSTHWYFISGKQNVADCASRGLSPSALVNHPSWFVGPNWLSLSPQKWPIQSFQNNSEHTATDSELLVHVVSREELPLYTLIEHFSSYSKLLNSSVYVLRFAKILPIGKVIQTADLEKAEFLLIQTIQQRHFPNEFYMIANNKILESKLRRLNPFIKDGIIRVGGRLSNSNIPFSQKHPILLPKKDPLVNLLIDYYHRKYCHTGPDLLLSLLRQKYWILSARSIVRQRTWKCNHCFKLKPKLNFPLMSDLPAERVNQAKAFLSTGVDYTGAFQITLGRRRGVKSQKAYVCLFICLATKAVHLELASDLSTDCFLAAFKRFLSRRGNCATLWSDRGTNFIGAKAKLDEINKFVTSVDYKSALQHELNNNKINWKFNPPSSPHFGGIWEANIKSVKAHLAKVIGLQILTYEEFNTVLTQIEALLNSRPLCCLSNDPNDPIALTPSHFLYGSPLSAFPVQDLSAEKPNLLNRYKLLDSIVQQYWKRWHIEYLTTLQIRQKWNLPNNPAKVGQVVVVMQENLPPLQWPLAIVDKLCVGKDGIARVAQIRTKTSSYLRPVVKLCPLPNQ